MVKRSPLAWALIALWCIFRAAAPNPASGADLSELLPELSPGDVLLVADSDGDILYGHNANRMYTPASTLKILTALAALHHFGASYRFKTEFYLDPEQNLKIKGYGDPLLTSEAWEQIALELAPALEQFGNLLVDDSYFSSHIVIPGRGNSTNPYDAPVGALCANFNTVFYRYDKKGRIVSAEPQTPITPLAREKIPALEIEKGRYTFLRDRNEIGRYAGELLVHFLNRRGVSHSGNIRPGRIGTTDRLLYTYRSGFSMETVVAKMLTYSNNFMANQILVSMGAHIYGPPGTLEKGISVLDRYCREELRLQHVQLAEGSGISRRNQLSAMDMLGILRSFAKYRHLLTGEGGIRYKSGTLAGIRTRAGYIEVPDQGPYYFVIFLKDSEIDIEDIMKAVAGHIHRAGSGSAEKKHGDV